MKFSVFKKLSIEQQWAMIIAKTVRDRLEYLHAGKEAKIPQSVMPELNRKMRFTILETVHLLMHHDEPEYAGALGFAVQSIPDYWEIPKFLRGEIEPRDDSSVTPMQRERADAKRELWFKTGKTTGK